MSGSTRRSRTAGTAPSPATDGTAEATPEDLRRIGRRRLWRLLAVLAGVALLAGLTAAAYLSPLMSVRQIDVTGTVAVAREDVLAVADVPAGKPLLQVDTGAIARRVAGLPGVESVRVDRSYPSTIAIDVVERTPRVLLERGDGRIGVMDRLGMVYLEFDSRESMGKAARGGTVLATLPTLSVPTPGPEDPTTRAALEVAGEWPDWLRRDVQSISASSPADLTLQLTKSRTVIWGDSGRHADKAEALAHVLKLPGRTFNVSSPDYPAVS